ncbi:hypothetical protein KBI52_10920 [Microvirga sp. HBU67558]|uniref:hypothetical protein n=1 Tax=Microvirga sp. HBU67558 TaxID=2824562 RepID=UPI001B36B9F8|nr:hypothetical protein [Microvirga sp. HBU67558]MBQ0820717.1 hypothetical protein [Microvirga sp. HBU67558]
MGHAKNQMMEREDEVQDVINRLKDAGAIVECEDHYTLIDNDDPDAVDEVRQELATEVGAAKGDELIEAAMAHAADECHDCRKIRAD